MERGVVFITYAIVFTFCRLFLDLGLLLPNLEVAGEMEHSEVMHQAVVVTLATDDGLGIPGLLQHLLHQILVAIFFKQGVGSNRIRTRLADGEIAVSVGAVPVEVAVPVAVPLEEVRDDLRNLRLALHIHTEQVAIHAVVHGAADGIERVLGGVVAESVMRSSVEVAVVAAKARLRVCGIVDVVAGRLRRLFPLVGVGSRPAAEQVYECGQTVRGVAPGVVAVARLERCNEGLFAVQGLTVAFPAGLQDALCVLHVVRVVPAVGRKQKRHHEVDFAVGSVAPVAHGTVAVRLPREIAGTTRGRIAPHVFLGPVPEFAELFLVVGLHGNHHAVAHAFGTDVVVVDIDDVAAVVVFVIHGLVVLAAKVMVPEFVKLILYVFVSLAEERLERARVIARVVGARRLRAILFAVGAKVGSAIVEECAGVY